MIPSTEPPPALPKDEPIAPPASRWRTGVRQALILSAIMMTSLGLYLSVEWLFGVSAQISTQTEWDKSIPFYPSWVWVYLFPYLIGPVVVGMLRPTTFAFFVRRGIPLVLVSLLIFIVLPTHTVRPDRAGLDDSLTSEMYRNMADTDGPAANAAPSLHVSLTCLLALCLLWDYPRWWFVSLPGIGIVWLSTLLTHQHHLIDVGTGILLALLFAVPWPFDRKRSTPLSVDGV